MADVKDMGLATAYKHIANGRSYMEVHYSVPGSKSLQILSLKANPDDAAQWLKDMKSQQQVGSHHPAASNLGCKGTKSDGSIRMYLLMALGVCMYANSHQPTQSQDSIPTLTISRWHFPCGLHVLCRSESSES